MNMKILAADQSVTNSDGSDYLSRLQASAVRSLLYKISYTNLTGGDIYLWVFNLAAGSASNNSDPVAVRRCPSGYADTWDFYSGSLFTQGIYVVVATSPLQNPQDGPTAATAGSALVKVDFRKEA